MQKWEYYLAVGRYHSRDEDNQLLADLAALGAQGWEAVSVVGEPFRAVKVLMKREVRE